MRRVIVNSTPLIALCNADLLNILKEIYGSIIIPKAVFDEVTAKKDSACLQIKQNLDWITVETITNIEDRKMYKAKLHAGEVDVMILAQADPKADLVIIDDNAAKKTAKYLGLTVTGTLGVLIKAKQSGIISSVKNAITKIQSNGFYINENIIKLAFFDVDGTLLRLGHKELSANTAAALRQLHQNGIILCMATGRSYTGVPHFDGIDFDVLLTFNGSFVTAGNDIIFKNPINEHDKYQIISNLKQMNRAIAISNEHMIVTNGTDPDLEQYFAFGSEKLKIADNFDEISRTDIYQIMCSCQKDEHSQILSGAPHSQITAWWDKAVDIIPLNSGKGNAVAAVLRHYGFSKDEAIAFGDGHNDIEMLEAVGIGVAMGNAKDEVKAKADFVCQSVENDGIYHYCVENKLIF